MRNFAALESTFDVVIIGGGATGLGAALDAVSRGYATALIEAHDFANATSSRSTKLVHGGVRYLAQGNIHLVREALHERSTLRRNAPHLVHDLGFLCPAYRWYEAPYYGAGLLAYDLLAGNANFGRSRFLGRREAIERAPHLRSEGLVGAIRYHDGQFDDARLAVALARTAVDRGAVVVNYARAVGFVRENGRIAGVRVRDEEGSDEAVARARVVVNATGVFTDELRRIDEGGARSLVKLSRGSHVVLPRELWPGEDALLVPKTDDGRVLFIIPWLGRTLVGTTDIPELEPALDPQPREDEIAYLLAHAARYMVRRPQREDVRAAFCGLRPLVDARSSATSALSREHVIETSKSGLVSICGGKWTTYRKMAQDVIDTASRVGSLAASPSCTVDLPLRGADGSDARERAALIARDPSLAALLHPTLAYTRADVVAARLYEMARTVDDVLARRTRIAFLDAAAAQACKRDVAELLEREP